MHTRDKLRVIRVNTQALQRSIGFLQGSDGEFAAQLPDQLVLWDENAHDVDTDLDLVRTATEQGDAGSVADEIEKVRNAWSEARQRFATFRATPGDEDARKAALAAIDDRLHLMVLQIGYLTIPQRLVETLGREWTGGALNFHKRFADELPHKADRVAVLEYLAESPQGLDALFDVDSGLVWAVSRSPWRRWRGYAAFIAILVAGLALAWYAHDIATAIGVTSPFAPTQNLLVAYLLVAFGVALHIGLDVVKRVRSTDQGRPVVLHELRLWGHVHEVQLLVTGFSIWGGTVILAGLENPISAWAAIVTGYTLDSVVDAAILRFNALASARAQVLTDNIGQVGAAP